MEEKEPIENLQDRLTDLIGKVDCALDAMGIDKKTIDEMLDDTDMNNNIETIEKTFPADSTDKEIREIGQRLLSTAIEMVFNWRKLSPAIMAKYAELCEKETGKQCE